MVCAWFVAPLYLALHAAPLRAPGARAPGPVASETAPKLPAKGLLATAQGMLATTAPLAIVTAAPSLPLSLFPFAPALTLAKYETMQSRRVRVVVAYTTAFAALVPEVEGGLKFRFPDIRVQRLFLVVSEGAPATLSVRVDGVMCASSTTPGRLYLPFARITLAVERARRRRRPKGDIYVTTLVQMDDESSKKREEAISRLELDTWHPAVRDEEERAAQGEEFDEEDEGDNKGWQNDSWQSDVVWSDI